MTRVNDIDGTTGADCYRCTTNPANVGHLCRACLAEITHAHAQVVDDYEGPTVKRQPWDVPFPRLSDVDLAHQAHMETK